MEIMIIHLLFIMMGELKATKIKMQKKVVPQMQMKRAKAAISDNCRLVSKLAYFN
jgi:hypothetical protein